MVIDRRMMFLTKLCANLAAMEDFVERDAIISSYPEREQFHIVTTVKALRSVKKRR